MSNIKSTVRRKLSKIAILRDVKVPSSILTQIIALECDTISILVLKFGIVLCVFPASEQSANLGADLLIACFLVVSIYLDGGYKDSRVGHIWVARRRALLCFRGTLALILAGFSLAKGPLDASWAKISLEVCATGISLTGTRFSFARLKRSRVRTCPPPRTVLTGPVKGIADISNCPERFDMRGDIFNSGHASQLNVQTDSNSCSINSDRAVSHDQIIFKNILGAVFLEKSNRLVSYHNHFVHCMEKLFFGRPRIWLAADMQHQPPQTSGFEAGTCKLVAMNSNQTRPLGQSMKRALDLLIATSALITVFPLMLLIAFLVKLTSPGPAIFHQERFGMHGKKFTLLKFRTMMPEKSEKFIQATVNDSRVTRVGRLLRRTSLDELPQLINVLKGDMSVVGPRPHAPETSINGVKFEVAVQDYHRRYCVKPGITGLAQIRGLRGETTRIEMLEQRIASDLEYIKNWSIWLDLTIMIKTIPLIFSQENAY